MGVGLLAAWQCVEEDATVEDLPAEEELCPEEQHVGEFPEVVAGYVDVVDSPVGVVEGVDGAGELADPL